jgi:hypothetical protein
LTKIELRLFNDDFSKLIRELALQNKSIVVASKRMEKGNVACDDLLTPDE